MSWRDLAWRGSVKPRDPAEVGNGFVASIGVTVGGGGAEPPAPAASRPRGRTALEGGGASGANVTVEPMSPRGSPARPPGRLK